ncbi:Alcohol dehydrogenase 2 [Zhongshania aliphaticivorans]|uniref:Alcohol dehydrogenase 2 n=1 Tax=Zhongshania aliphaticivorans TaxID=1470434 RepID=A0A5S9NSE6_9GAMM|nr:iron-containing alcohol dehydrogenase [Zhongshania aliphaticivorans]CAA0093565.1 Alcohol dehydrogenase 2 [Zhongshania aliphaticivorans]CAA0111543.1 Alcohol dehydrogenase 2 [Zhongshania aliphaticivorans]
MIFALQTLFYKTIIFFTGLLLKIVPVPKPMIYSGPDSSLQLCNNIIHFGYKSVIIVTDAMLHEMGLVDAIKDKLSAAGINVSVYDGVEPNPTFAQVHAGLELAKSNNCDAVLAFGGGSSIDAAKVISVAATNNKTPEALVGYFKAKKPGLPLYAVPSTAGTGSEVSVAAVISDPVTHKKGIIGDPKTVPVAAALDPNIMLGLPAPITAATGMDALTHAIEAYLATIASDESDAYALAAAKLIFENLPEVYSNGGNVSAREAMAVASCYAALAFNKTALGYVHGIAHQFSGHYNTPHGVANAIVLPTILDFQQDASEKRLAELAVATGQANASDSTAIQAKKFVAAVRQLSADLNIPSTLDALQTADIPAIAKAALKESHYGYAVPKYMNQQQCEALISKLVS